MVITGFNKSPLVVNHFSVQYSTAYSYQEVIDALSELKEKTPLAGHCVWIFSHEFKKGQSGGEQCVWQLNEKGCPTKKFLVYGLGYARDRKTADFLIEVMRQIILLDIPYVIVSMAEYLDMRRVTFGSEKQSMN